MKNMKMKKNIKKSNQNTNGNDIEDNTQTRDHLHNPCPKPIPNHNYGITENANRNQIILVKCKYCAEHDPMLKIVSSRRYMIQNDFKLIKYSLKYNKNSKKKNSTLVYVGICERILILYQPLESVYFMYRMK
jgi:hypothetical protein